MKKEQKKEPKKSIKTVFDEQIELVDTLELTEEMKEEITLPYLRDLYKDLLKRSDNREKGIPRVILLDYFKLPGMIGERLFTIFDANGDGYSAKEEFFAGAFRILSQSFESNIKLIFDLYDFDKDKIITSEDIRTLLSSVPLSEFHLTAKDKAVKEGLFTQSGRGFEEYFDRVKSQEELQELLTLCLKDKGRLRFEEFKNITEKVFIERD